MKEQKKKRLIAILLFVSCFISGYMLFETSDWGTRQLNDVAQADSLIHQQLDEFNIREQQIRITTTRIDSNFSRKTYRVALPYQFSKTQFHSELNKTLHEYAIETPARVTFPEKNVNIHLTYRGNVIRTISLQTDPELTLNKNHVSILVSFDELPVDELISQIVRLGEPIPIVLKVENPMQANDLKKELNSRYNRILFWLQNNEGENILENDPKSALKRYKQFEDVLPDAKILQLRHHKLLHTKLVANTNLAFIDASQARLLREDMGKSAFFEEFYKLQSDESYTMVIISGTESTLTWLQEKLPELSKAGIELVAPPQKNF